MSLVRDKEGAGDAGVQRRELQPVRDGQLQEMGVRGLIGRLAPVGKSTRGLVVGQESMALAQSRQHAHQDFACQRDRQLAATTLD